MKQLVFVKRKDCYEVRIYETGDERDWKKFGNLRLDNQGRWTLKSAKLKKTYFKSLTHTYDSLEQDLLELLQN